MGYTARMMASAAPLPPMTPRRARKSGGSGPFRAIPQKDSKQKELEIASKTWFGEGSWKIGGGDVWHAITYDDATGLVIFGTAGADVGYGEMTGVKVYRRKALLPVHHRGEAGHRRICLAFPDRHRGHALGKQPDHDGRPHDQRGKASRGDDRPQEWLLYILDAKTGKLFSAKPLVKTTWASSYDLQTGRPVLIPASQGGGKQWTAHNWWPMSYSSLTGLVYIPSTDRRSDTKAALEAGESGEGLYGRLIAWDPVAETARWSVEEQISVNGGVLSTAGNLVFQGQGTGEFAAYAADTGKKLWSIQTKSAIDSIPVTFSVNGEQYVITSVGWGSGSRLFAPARTMATPESKRGPNRLYAFKLGGKVPFPAPRIEIPPVPKPPEQKVSEGIIRKGEKLYVSFYCEGCHSPFIDGQWRLGGGRRDPRSALRPA